MQEQLGVDAEVDGAYTASPASPIAAGPRRVERKIRKLVEGSGPLLETIEGDRDYQVNKRITLRHQLLERLPKGVVCGSSRLIKLDVSNNRLTFLPESISKLTALQTLNVNHNFLVSLPAALGSCKQLSDISALNNGIQYLPRSLTMLTSLLSFNIDKNGLGSVPVPTTRLTSLSVSVNRLNCMSRLRELQELSLSNNPLREVPDVVYKLTTLEVLGLRSCMLKKLSNKVVRLRKLKKLDLSYNELQRLPDRLNGMQCLLRVERNNFDYFFPMDELDCIKLPEIHLKTLDSEGKADDCTVDTQLVLPSVASGVQKVAQRLKRKSADRRRKGKDTSRTRLLELPPGAGPSRIFSFYQNNGFGPTTTTYPY